MTLRFRDATLDDVAAIAGLQNAAAGALTTRYGPGPWSALVNERGIALGLHHARVRVGKDGKRTLTVLRLATKKPWAIDCLLLHTGKAAAVSDGDGRLGGPSSLQE